MPNDELAMFRIYVDAGYLERMRPHVSATVLYAALEAFYCDDCGNRIGESWPWPKDECETCKPARAALAKARGEQTPDAPTK